MKVSAATLAMGLSVLPSAFASAVPSVRNSAPTKRDAGLQWSQDQIDSIMQIVNTWDHLYNITKKEWNNDRYLDSLACGQTDSAAQQEEHCAAQRPWDAVWAQVIAPADPKYSQTDPVPQSFAAAYWFGWLCESPNDPQLGGACGDDTYYEHTPGETGHHDILTNGAYTQIGCSFTPNALGQDEGVWICDLSGSYS